LLIYVNKDNRKLGYASMLLNEIPVYFREKILNKIYLEVASSNLSALNLYKKNEFQKTGYRKEYYLINDKRIDAYFFEKKINE
jgi:ribosomal protein S18 acetylase RimI-like enzyme